jgi:prolyl-tRNA synthetase
LVLPPKLAPVQVMIVPIYKSQEQRESIAQVANDLLTKFRALGISAKFDNRDEYRPGAKFAQHELQGVPLRIGIGPRDLENNTAELARRDTLSKESVSLDTLESTIPELLDQIQEDLFQKALQFRDDHITEVDNFEEFKKILESKGGFISAHWDGSSETEQKIKELTKATIRCIPYDQKQETGVCVFSGKPSAGRVLFAKAY